MGLTDAQDDGVRFIRCFGPMHLDAVAREAFFKLHKQRRQLAKVVLANLLAQRAQGFQFFGAGELRDALVDQEIHGATEALAQEGIFDHVLGASAEALGGHEVHCVFAHASSPISRTTSSFGPWAP